MVKVTKVTSLRVLNSNSRTKFSCATQTETLLSTRIYRNAVERTRSPERTHFPQPEKNSTGNA